MASNSRQEANACTRKKNIINTGPVSQEIASTSSLLLLVSKQYLWSSSMTMYVYTNWNGHIQQIQYLERKESVLAGKQDRGPSHSAGQRIHLHCSVMDIQKKIWQLTWDIQKMFKKFLAGADTFHQWFMLYNASICLTSWSQHSENLTNNRRLDSSFECKATFLTAWTCWWVVSKRCAITLLHSKMAIGNWDNRRIKIELRNRPLLSFFSNRGSRSTTPCCWVRASRSTHSWPMTLGIRESKLTEATLPQDNFPTLRQHNDNREGSKCKDKDATSMISVSNEFSWWCDICSVAAPSRKPYTHTHNLTPGQAHTIIIGVLP